MNGLEVRQLRYFVAVAEELHFGRAAEQLRMAQPPLSRAIRQLEQQLGVTLLERTTRQVVLTPAGQVLLRDARGALEAMAAAERRTRHAGAAVPVLRLALKADLDAGLLPAILAAYGEEPDALPVELVLGGFAEQAGALRDGRADVGLLLRPYDERGLDGEELLTEPMLIALAAGDPLAARPRLRLADVAGRRRPGDGSASDLTEIFRLVELGSMVCFLPRSVTLRYPRPELAYRAVEDLPPTTFTLAWPEHATSRAIAGFVRAAGKAAAASPAPR